MYTKKGHQAPREWKRNRFSRIEIEGDLHFCVSHNFIYNAEEEKRKLYFAQPNYYTDTRFYDSDFNFYKETLLYWKRGECGELSLRSCMRRVNSCKGIPKGTTVKFNVDWYWPGKKTINSYFFKVKKENPLSIQFEINDPRYSNNFVTCEFSRELTNQLRANGFIVAVNQQNPSRLSAMLASAVKSTGGQMDVEQEEGETAVAYGHGKKIGFSSGKDTLFGYSSGIKNILYDEYGCFDKWSRCEQISKRTPIEEIVNILMQPNKSEEDGY